MNDVITTELLIDALADAGLRDATTARRMVDATLAVMFQRLTADERDTFGRALSKELRERLPHLGEAQSFDAEGMYGRIAQRAHASAAVAREQAQVIIETIGRHASYDVLRRIAHALPAPVSALLEARELGEPPPYVETFPAAQAHSVVREDNPHADRKLSSGKPNLKPSDPARSTR